MIDSKKSMENHWVVYSRIPPMYNDQKYYTCREEYFNNYNNIIAEREIIKKNLTKKEAYSFRDILRKLKGV